MKLKSQMAISQRAEQRLGLSNEMKQAIHVLTLTNADLTGYLEGLYLENPLLELDYPPATRTSSDQRIHDMLSRASQPAETLPSHCINQIRMLDLPPRLVRIACFLAGNLDDNGYLTVSTREAQTVLGCPLPEIDEGLAVLQSLEPAGIGARSLKECLQLQLRRFDPVPEAALAIAEYHLEELARGNVRAMAQALGMSVPEIEEACRLIRSLDPRPGASIGRWEMPRVIPDAIVRFEGGRLVVKINEAGLPTVRIRDDYAVLRHDPVNRDHKRYLENHWQAGQWLIRSLAQRKQTLYRVITATMEEQLSFFTKGMAGLVPLAMRHIAGKLGLHESTVSRAVQGKYVDTPCGVLELRRFFDTGRIEGQDGAASAAQVKHLIKRMIAEEDKSKPLSDQEIADALKQRHIRISRRTVAKYREEMQLLASAFRKR